MRIREWLNEDGHHSTGFVFLDTDEGILRISDCQRQVDLSLSSYDLDSVENTISKLDTLVWVVKEAQREMKKTRTRLRRER